MKFEYFYSSSFLFIFMWLVSGSVNHVALHTIFVSSTFLGMLLSHTLLLARHIHPPCAILQSYRSPYQSAHIKDQTR